MAIFYQNTVRMKFKIEGEIGFMQAFADELKVTIQNNHKIEIPEQFGKGFLVGFIYDDTTTLLVRNYYLNDDLIVKRSNQSSSSNSRIIISFQNVFEPLIDKSIRELPSVRIISRDLNSEIILPKLKEERNINIGITTNYLKKLIGIDSENIFMKSILNENNQFIFEQLISPKIRSIADEMIKNRLHDDLQKFYFKIKSEELICQLINELISREEVTISNINGNDLKSIYLIKEKVISKLDIPPNLKTLAMEANMSESKLKRLFKQIFGSSLYNYYQSIRMKEAARLLREDKLSVSEVGYKLGFSNLSHFGKVFEDFIGVKPKKYSKNG